MYLPNSFLVNIVVAIFTHRVRFSRIVIAGIVAWCQWFKQIRLYLAGYLLVIPEEVRPCLTKYWRKYITVNPNRTVSLSEFSFFSWVKQECSHKGANKASFLKDKEIATKAQWSSLVWVGRWGWDSAVCAANIGSKNRIFREIWGNYSVRLRRGKRLTFRVIGWFEKIERSEFKL